MLAMSPLVPVPDIAAPESINHGWAYDDAVAMMIGGARNIPRGFVIMQERSGPRRRYLRPRSSIFNNYCKSNGISFELVLCLSRQEWYKDMLQAFHIRQMNKSNTMYSLMGCHLHVLYIQD